MTVDEADCEFWRTGVALLPIHPEQGGGLDLSLGRPVSAVARDLELRGAVRELVKSFYGAKGEHCPSLHWPLGATFESGRHPRDPQTRWALGARNDLRHSIVNIFARSRRVSAWRPRRFFFSKTP